MADGNVVRLKLTKLLLICKDLSLLLGPMMFSRMEVVVKDFAHWRDRERTLYRRLRIADNNKKYLQEVYDAGLSVLHHTLVERYDDRVWVDGADRDREIGLFGAARAERVREQAEKDKKAREAKAKRLWSDVVKGGRSGPSGGGRA
jgi:hypothetical protein